MHSIHHNILWKQDTEEQIDYCISVVLLISSLLAWKQHKYVYENASFTHSILCTDAFWIDFSMAFILSESSTSVKHLDASWMVFDVFGRIIKNQSLSE